MTRTCLYCRGRNVATGRCTRCDTAGDGGAVAPRAVGSRLTSAAGMGAIAGIRHAGISRRGRPILAVALVLLLVGATDVLGAVPGASQAAPAPQGPVLLRSLAPGHITTYAGGQQDPQGAPTGWKIRPVAVALDGPDGVLIADRSSGVVWLVNTVRLPIARFGQVVDAGQMAVVAGNTGQVNAGDGVLATETGMQPAGIAVDRAGNLYIADEANGLIRKVAAASGIITTVAGNPGAGPFGDGGPARLSRLVAPSGIAVDSVGNLYIADGNRVRKVAVVTGLISRVAGSSLFGGYSGDGGPATIAALHSPTAVAVDQTGNLYIADSDNNRVRRVAATTGTIATVAGNGLIASGTLSGISSGDGGPAARAGLSTPTGVAVDAAGNLYIADAGAGHIRKVASITGIITTVAGSGHSTNGGDNGPAIRAGLNDPSAVSADAMGNLYIVDGGNNRVRLVTAATGTITTLAGGGPLGGLRDGAFSGEGGPAPRAGLNQPLGLGVDGQGNLYIADSGNGRIREVAASTGTISTVAGSGAGTRDDHGRLVGADSGDGGPAIRAGLDSPSLVTADAAGNLYLIGGRDNYLIGGSNRVRRVAASTGIIATVAGTGQAGYSGDGGPAIKARLHAATGLAVDSAGNLYISDSANNRVRKVSATTGIITTVAGDGLPGRRRRPGDARGGRQPRAACGGPGGQSLHQRRGESDPQGGGEHRDHHYRGRRWPDGLQRRRRAGHHGTVLLDSRAGGRWCGRSLHRGRLQLPRP